MDLQGDPQVSAFHRTCFACGPDNPDGLQIRFVTDGNANRASIVIDGRFQGYEAIAQGGIVATILDTAMVQLLHDLFGGHPVTMRLDVRFLRETPVRTPLFAVARIIRSRRNVHWVAAEIHQGSMCCASALGTFTMRQNATPVPVTSGPS